MFSSDPAVSSSIFVGAEREENLVEGLHVLEGRKGNTVEDRSVWKTEGKKGWRNSDPTP